MRIRIESSKFDDVKVHQSACRGSSNASSRRKAMSAYNSSKWQHQCCSEQYTPCITTPAPSQPAAADASAAKVNTVFSVAPSSA